MKQSPPPQMRFTEGAVTIRLEVDARFIANAPSSESTGLLNLEASNDSNYSLKIVSDIKLKLAIESKVIVDHIVDFLPKDYQIKYVPAQKIHISGLQAEIFSLKLVDSGLYIHDITLISPSPLQKVCSNRSSKGAPNGHMYSKLQKGVDRFSKPTSSLRGNTIGTKYQISWEHLVHSFTCTDLRSSKNIFLIRCCQ
ncbi:hypothetical protein BD770DRAFT_406474 [Pilaira anomala]|nr:hypothetical protein BD770DRAFT_406474 [Pilaira anomala]